MSDAVSRRYWRPNYPENPDAVIALEDLDLDMYVMDGKPVVSVAECEVVDPACFWLDSGNVYLRVNWRQWGLISGIDQAQFEVLKSSCSCNLMISSNKNVSTISVSVYHISSLPEKLFQRPDAGDVNRMFDRVMADFIF